VSLQIATKKSQGVIIRVSKPSTHDSAIQKVENIRHRNQSPRPRPLHPPAGTGIPIITAGRPRPDVEHFNPGQIEDRVGDNQFLMRRP
jgi:hypothetical protein